MTGLDRADLDAVRSLEHHSERPAAQLAQGRTFADRENNPPRRMLEEAVPVEGRAVGDPVWPTGENGSDGKRDVLGGGACAKGAERAHDVVAAGNAVDEAPMDKPRQKVRSSLRREAGELFHVPRREGFLPLHSKLVENPDIAGRRRHS